MSRHTKIFSGSSNVDLVQKVVARLGTPLAKSSVTQFANAETSIVISESVREEDVYIFQSGSPSVNDGVMELLIMINACKMASARRVTAVLPFYPYSKQCKKKSRSSITAKLVANMLRVAGVDHVITMDLHASQMQGFFGIPVDNLYAEPAIAQYIRANIPDFTNGVIVAKNPGATRRVTSLADRLQVDFALIHIENKTKHVEGVPKKLRVVGDVQGKIAFITDDMIDGVKTFRAAAQTLKESGAQRVYLVATHGLFTEKTLRAIQDDASIHEVIITNTIALTRSGPLDKIRVIDLSAVFAESVRRTHNGESVSYLFQNVPE